MSIRKTILPLFLITLFFSCTKEDNSPSSQAPTAEISAATYLQQNAFQEIIFQYEVINEDQNLISGWYITNTGDLLNFETEYSNLDFRTDDVIDFYQLQKVKQYTDETIAQVDLEELVTHFKLIPGAASGELSELITDTTKSTYEAFYAFTIVDETGAACSGESCYSGGVDEPQVEYSYMKTLIQSTGKYEQENMAANAQTIQAWLVQTKEAL